MRRTDVLPVLEDILKYIVQNCLGLIPFGNIGIDQRRMLNSIFWMRGVKFLILFFARFKRL